MILGQEKICNWIDSTSLDEFPRSLMLVGSEGSGKHLLCDYISKKFNLVSTDITENLDLETIEEFYNRVEPYLYIIRANDLSIKQENTILKFLEEPLKNSFIVLIAETDIGILPTILNRCQVWYLQNYKKQFLQSFLKNQDNDMILTIATTPGQVLQLADCDFQSVVELADKIIDKISIASISNTLTLSNKVGFKNEKDKINFRILVNVLIARIRDRWVSSANQNYVRAYSLTSELNKLFAVKNLDHKLLFEKYLIELRSCMRGD